MALQALVQLSHALQAAALATLIYAVSAYLSKFNYKKQLARLPVLGASTSGEKQRQTYISSAKKLYSEGYAKVRFHICDKLRVLITRYSSKTLSTS